MVHHRNHLADHSVDIRGVRSADLRELDGVDLGVVVLLRLMRGPNVGRGEVLGAFNVLIELLDDLSIGAYGVEDAGKFVRGQFCEGFDELGLRELVVECFGRADGLDELSGRLVMTMRVFQPH